MKGGLGFLFIRRALFNGIYNTRVKESFTETYLKLQNRRNKNSYDNNMIDFMLLRLFSRNAFMVLPLFYFLVLWNYVLFIYFYFSCQIRFWMTDHPETCNSGRTCV